MSDGLWHDVDSQDYSKHSPSCKYCQERKTMKTLREKIKKEIQGAFSDGCAFNNGDEHKVNKTADSRTDSILKLMEEAVPKEKKAQYTSSVEGGISGMMDEAFNRCRSEILKKIKGGK